QGGSRARQPAPGARGGAAQSGARDAGDHRPGRPAGRDPLDALAFAVAAADRARPHRGLRHARHAALLDRIRVPRGGRADPAGVAPERGAGMTDAAGQVPRSAHAERSRAAAAVDRSRAAQPSGWWGMALFLCSEATLFGTLIGSYFYLNFGSHRWPPAGITPPEIPGPAITTAVLVGTVPLMVVAAAAARRGRRWGAVRWI